MSTAALASNATQQASLLSGSMANGNCCMPEVADNLEATTLGSLLGALSPASNQTTGNQTSVQQAKLFLDLPQTSLAK